MKISELHNYSIAILGFGMEGQDVARFLTKHKLSFVVYDKLLQTKWPADKTALLKKCSALCVTGPDYLKSAISNHNLIFRSPGIKIPEQLLKVAQTNNCLITSQTKLFFANCPAKIIGITGTKGKGTTSSLIYSILSLWKTTIKESVKVFLTGNIGKTQPLEFLDQLSNNDLVVYELSSFQLLDLTQSPYIGICLMVTADHLNYHKDLEEYWQAKQAIAKYQTTTDQIIYNQDYQASVVIAQTGKGQRWQISSKSNPSHGVLIGDEQITIFGYNNVSLQISTNKRLLRGKHNLENIAAACMATVLLGVSPEIISEGIVNFKGLEHRLEYITTKKQVSFFNDSIATIPDATVVAVKSFQESVVLIMGGANKGLDYNDAIDQLSTLPNLKAIVTIGETGIEIQRLFKRKSSSAQLLGPYTDFHLAIFEAIKIAQAGDVVLLSPGSASFDMFKSYAERGHKFSSLVNQID